MIDIKEQLEAIRGLKPHLLTTGQSASIKEVATGGYIEISGRTYRITEDYKYLDVKWDDFGKRKKKYWVTELQLFDVLSGDKTFVEWEVDDELEVYITTEKVRLLDIDFNGSPLSRTDLINIAEEECGSVIYKGKKYHYSDDDTWAALFYKGDDEPLKVRMYEFSSADDKSLTIELWEDEDSKPDREAFTSAEIKPSAITIIQTKADEESSSEVTNAVL